MKKMGMVTGISLLMAGCATTGVWVPPETPSPPSQGLKHRVAVAGFEVKVPGARREIGRGVEEMLITSLVNTGKFVVVERGSLKDILREQRLRKEGWLTPETAPLRKKLLGAQFLIRGAITEFTHRKAGGGAVFLFQGYTLGGAQYVATVGMDIRMYETTTGEILLSQEVKGIARAGGLLVGGEIGEVKIGAGGFSETPLGEATREAIRKAVELITQKSLSTPWRGRVVKLEGTRVYINAGLDSNLRSGDTFVVYRLGEELIDPETGLPLGREEERAGKIKVIEVKEKYSVAEILEGGGFKRGDIVRPE